MVVYVLVAVGLKLGRKTAALGKAMARRSERTSLASRGKRVDLETERSAGKPLRDGSVKEEGAKQRNEAAKARGPISL